MASHKRPVFTKADWCLLGAASIGWFSGRLYGHVIPLGWGWLAMTVVGGLLLLALSNALDK